ncbi:hypothetical protein [Candidatus Nitrososphaera sp. FF02]|uniref:hypothetical protein n=1 Tax=Candidatus Nitrososphaera sp. FF02 TaxID=3398226 RepID=UPI0039E8BCA8
MLVALWSSLYAGSSASAQSNDNLEISGADVARADSIARADPQVQSYLTDKSFYLMSHGASTNDNEPGVVRPVLVYNIDNKDQLAVTVDLETNAVKEVLYLPDTVIEPPTAESESPESGMGYWIIAIAAGIAVSAGVAIVYFKTRRKQNLGAKRV